MTAKIAFKVSTKSKFIEHVAFRYRAYHKILEGTDLWAKRPKEAILEELEMLAEDGNLTEETAFKVLKDRKFLRHVCRVCNEDVERLAVLADGTGKEFYVCKKCLVDIGRIL